MLTAKAIKISERLEQATSQPARLKEKDALDAFRIFQAIDTAVLLTGFQSHQASAPAAAVTAEAIDIYRTHASSPQGAIALLASSAVRLLASSAARGDPTVAPAFAALVNDLLDGL